MGAPTTPCVYLVPDGFTGWAFVEFAVPGAPALPHEGGARVLRIPPDGHLRTSSAQELGVIEHRFYREGGDPLEQPEAQYGAAPDAAYRAHDHPVVLGYHTGHATDDDGAHLFECFYVGTGPAGDPPSGRS